MGTNSSTIASGARDASLTTATVTKILEPLAIAAAKHLVLKPNGESNARPYDLATNGRDLESTIIAVASDAADDGKHDAAAEPKPEPVANGHASANAADDHDDAEYDVLRQYSGLSSIDSVARPVIDLADEKATESLRQHVL